MIKPGNYKLIVKIFSRIILLYTVLTLFFVYGLSIMNLMNSGAERVAIKNSFFLFPLAVAGVAYDSVKRGYLGKPQVRLKNNGSIMLTSVLVTILLSVVFQMLDSIYPLPDFLENHRNLRNQPLFIISAVLVAPVAEEIIFRGVITRDLLRYHSEKTTILISGLLFGLIHVNPAQVLPASFAGFFLAWLYIRTNHLGICILLHFANNAIAVLMFYLIPDDALPISRMLAAIILGLSVLFLGYFLFQLRRGLNAAMNDDDPEIHISSQVVDA